MKVFDDYTSPMYALVSMVSNLGERFVFYWISSSLLVSLDSFHILLTYLFQRFCGFGELFSCSDSFSCSCRRLLSIRSLVSSSYFSGQRVLKIRKTIGVCFGRYRKLMGTFFICSKPLISL